MQMLFLRTDLRHAQEAIDHNAAGGNALCDDGSPGGAGYAHFKHNDKREIEHDIEHRRD